MKLLLILLVFTSLVGCSTPPVKQEFTYPLLEEVEDNFGYRTEVWRREDGSRFIRFQLNGKTREMEIR